MLLGKNMFHTIRFIERVASPDPLAIRAQITVGGLA
jgi:hypothetical protein